jgi:uncharacterized protein
MEEISLPEARRIALAAQGFADPRPPGRPGAQHVRRVVDRLGVVQIDSVDVLCRAHYLPAFSRLGPYPRRLLDTGPYFEYWGHRASLLPLAAYPLFRWRMEAGSRHVFGADLSRWRTEVDPALWEAPWAVLEGMTRIAKEQPGLLDDVLAIVGDQGPVTAGKIGPATGRGPAAEGGRMWNWHDAKIALEWLFYCGRVAIAGRLPGFERLYDLTERVIPAEVLDAPVPSREDAQRELTRISARALGVATARELQRYFHLPPPESRTRIAELVEAGELLPVRVEGKKMFLWPSDPPRDIDACTLLSPFDPLVWERDRTLRLFGFHYRIGLYTPAAKRTHGYYALPFLLGDRLVGWVDLKADRTRSALLVQQSHLEPDAAPALAAELGLLAEWLDLEPPELENQPL